MAEQPFKNLSPESSIEKNSSIVNPEVQNIPLVEKETIQNRTTSQPVEVDSNFEADIVASEEDLYKKMHIEEGSLYQVSGEIVLYNEIESRISEKFIVK